MTDSGQTERKILPVPQCEKSEKLLDPFKIDPYKRGMFAENLTNLFRNSKDSLTISIDADWGEGKITFIKQWIQSLKKDKQFIPIYYDAFKYDYTQNAFDSIAAIIHKNLQEHAEGDYFKTINKKQLQELKQATYSLSFKLVPFAAAYAMHPVKESRLFAFALIMYDFFARLLPKIFKRNTGSPIDSVINYEKAIFSYQNSLRSIMTSKNSSNRKIIFFIDELDRCRPNFSIEVIEKIKHLFCVDNGWIQFRSATPGSLLSTSTGVR